jgi:hypothetical protein
MKSAEAILLPVQHAQQDHDLLAHRDILNLDTQTRLKHMTLHFLKYAGKMAVASERSDCEALGAVIVDSFIICLATANALNVSLGASLDIRADSLDDLARRMAPDLPPVQLFARALTEQVKIAGQMAKAIESTDHLERGNPRADLEELIVALAAAMLRIAGGLRLRLDDDIRRRWAAVESRSIFRRTPAN